MSAAAVVLIIAVVLIVLALVVFLVATILELRKIVAGLDDVIEHVGGIVEKSAPVNEVVTTINEQLDAGVELLEGLLVKKAGLTDAVGLVDGLYPGAAAAGLRAFPESTEIAAPRIGEVYTKGTLTLARLGREAPIAAASPHGRGDAPGGVADALEQDDHDGEYDEEQHKVPDPPERHRGLRSATMAALRAISGSAPRITSNWWLIALTAPSSGRRCSASTPSSAVPSVPSPREIAISRRRISISASARTATTTAARMTASATWVLIARRTRR